MKQHIRDTLDRLVVKCYETLRGHHVATASDWQRLANDLIRASNIADAEASRLDPQYARDGLVDHIKAGVS